MTFVKKLLALTLCLMIVSAVFSLNSAKAQATAAGDEPDIITEDMVGENNITDEHVGYYAILTAEDLLWFGEAVSSGMTDISALLVADIALNEGLLSEKIVIDPFTGEPNVKAGITVRSWVPLQSFSGTIDGGGHTISGVYIKSETDNTGLISMLVAGGAVKNLKISNSYIYSRENSTGAIAGENHGVISNVSVSADVVSLGEYTGAVAGKNFGDIVKCESHGNVFGSNLVGGISGANYGAITHCYSDQDGEFSYIAGERGVGGIIGKNAGEVSYCYSVSAINGVGYGICCAVEYGSKFVGCYYLFGEEDPFDGTERKGMESFKSGEVCYLLNGGGEVFFQTVGEGFPTFSGERVFVSLVYDCPGSEPRADFYTNDLNAQNNVIIYPDHLYSHGCDRYCDFCNFERNDTEMHTIVDKCGEKCENCGEITTHVYDNACDFECNICGDKRENTPHKYLTCLDAKCYECGYTREAIGHIYDNACDVDCNSCGEQRDIQHRYTYPCSKECEICGVTREAQDHLYSNDCDSDCGYCGAARDASHVYDGDCDSSCNTCGDVRAEAGEHIYTNSCDGECNTCGYERSDIQHSYTNACDAECDICGEGREVPGHVSSYPCDSSCDVCGTELDAEEHLYSNDCDDSCNLCGYERVVEDHLYSSACDSTCEQCGFERQVSGHKYDNSCDNSCELCGEIRDTLEHRYDSECDDTCNLCNHVREVSGHEFGEYFIVLQPTELEDGIKSRECEICGVRESMTVSKIEESSPSILVLVLTIAAVVVVIIFTIFVGMKIYGKRRLNRFRR